MNDINFQGGFLIRKPSTTKWRNIKDLLPNKKCVFEQFNENGDKFVATQTCYDKDMLAMLLRQKNADIVFYPKINLKSRLDTYYPEEAHRIIDSQTSVITDRKEQLRYLKNICKSMSAVPKRQFHQYKWKQDDHIDKTLKALGLSPEECKVEIEKGITFIKDKKGKNNIAIASPNTQNGYNYVYIFPQNRNSHETARRVVLDEFGNEQHSFSVFENRQFKENFERAVKIDNGRIRPKK